MVPITRAYRYQSPSPSAPPFVEPSGHQGAWRGGRVVATVEEGFSRRQQAADVACEEFDTSAPVVDGMPERYFASVTQAFIDARLARQRRWKRSVVSLASASVRRVRAGEDGA